MEKINCEVIKDLIPLYIDEVLSEESCKLVQSHLAVCSDCKNYYEKMQNLDFNFTKGKTSEEINVIKKIRRKITAKKLILICLTAIIVAAITFCGYYGLVLKQSYLPYENTELYVEGDELYSSKPYYCYYGFALLNLKNGFTYFVVISCMMQKTLKHILLTVYFFHYDWIFNFCNQTTKFVEAVNS